MKPRYIRYSDARPMIRNADQLFFRNRPLDWIPRVSIVICLWGAIAIGVHLISLHAFGHKLPWLWLGSPILSATAFLVYVAYQTAITVIGRSVYDHAAKAIWWPVGRVLNESTELDDSDVIPADEVGDKRLMCVEMRIMSGGRAVTLRSQVEKYPGLIDVYETNPDCRFAHYNPTAAALHMLNLCGTPYAIGGLLRTALLYIPLVRLYAKPDLDADEDDSASGRSPRRPRYCSQACVESDRVGGAEPLENLSPRVTDPGTLALSNFYRYIGTLVPDDDPRGVAA